MVQEIKKTHDCLGCLNCRKSKGIEDRDIEIECNLLKKGFVENNTIETSTNYESKLFNSRKQEHFLPYNIWVEITNACNLKCRILWSKLCEISLIVFPQEWNF